MSLTLVLIPAHTLGPVAYLAEAKFPIPLPAWSLELGGPGDLVDSCLSHWVSILFLHRRVFFPFGGLAVFSGLYVSLLKFYLFTAVYTKVCHKLESMLPPDWKSLFIREMVV